MVLDEDGNDSRLWRLGLHDGRFFRETFPGNQRLVVDGELHDFAVNGAFLSLGAIGERI